MELKLLEQSIAVSRTVFEQTIEQVLDAEFTLPDYYPEMERILKCCVQPSVTSKAMSGSSIVIDGTAYITLIYADSEGAAHGYSYQLPFSRTVDIGAGSGALSLRCSAVMDYAGCRAITARRVSVHAAAALKVSAIARQSVATIADIDEETVQTLRESRAARLPMAVVEKQFTVEEEIKLDSGKASVTVVRASGDAVCSECKIMGGKVVVKGRLAMSGLFRSTAGCERISADLPLSQILDVEGITETCTCLAGFEVLSLELRPKTGISGEVGAFTLTARLAITVEAFCNSELSLLRDAFSTKFESKLSKCEVTLEHPLRTVDEGFVCRKNLDFPEGSFAEVVDVWCILGTEQVRREADALVIGGELQVCILAKDSADAAVYCERTTDYEYRVQPERMPERIKCTTAVHMGAVSFAVQGSGIELRAEIKLAAAICEVETLSVLCGMSLIEDQPKSAPDDSSLVMYFASAGERLWDIARMYNTSADEIGRVNELSGDTMQNSRMLLIPCLY